MDQTHPASGKSYLVDGVAPMPLFDCSWWLALHAWLKKRYCPVVPAWAIDPAGMLGDAPGDYVKVRYADGS